MEAFQHGLEGLLRRSSAHWPAGREEQVAVPEWALLVEISEDDQEYLVKAELSEVKKEDVKVTAKQGALNITGERKVEMEEKGKKHQRIERSRGRFVRNFSLPDDANPANVSAEFIDGVLRVHLSKKEKSKPQQVEVVDEVLVWWQKALGKQAVLGQASNRATPGQRAPAPRLVWTKPEDEHHEQEKKVAEAAPITQKSHLGSDKNLTTLEQLKCWSGEFVTDTVIFLAVVLLRFTNAVYVTIRVAVDILAVPFRWLRRCPWSARGLLAANESTAGRG
jgi:HSP20 family protein